MEMSNQIHSSALFPRATASNNHWMGLKAGLNVLMIKIPVSAGIRTSIVKPVASDFTKCWQNLVSKTTEIRQFKLLFKREMRKCIGQQRFCRKN